MHLITASLLMSAWTFEAQPGQSGAQALSLSLQLVQEGRSSGACNCSRLVLPILQAPVSTRGCVVHPGEESIQLEGRLVEGAAGACRRVLEVQLVQQGREAGVAGLQHGASP